MLRPRVILFVTAALILPSSAVANAASPSSAAAGAGLASPIVAVPSANALPPGFTVSAGQAIAAAKSSRAMQALHKREHPLIFQPYVWAGGQKHFWYILFRYRGKVVAEADVSPTGRVDAVWTGPQATATYTHGHYAPVFDSWWVVVPFSLLFLLPFINPRVPRRLVHLDALVVLSLMGSYALFDHGHLQSAVWLIYPPLLYLLIRMGLIGLRAPVGGGGLSSLMSTRVLVGGLLLLVGARVALSLASGTVIDVGYSSVVGAYRLAHGMPLYWPAAAHADTYGPIAYLAYLPFELLFPWHGRWDYLASAHAASIVFDLVTLVGLVFVGRRLRAGAEGRRLGLALAWVWAACPFTLLGLTEHSNDGLIAMLSVLSLLVFSSPVARGGLLGLAAAAKFSPAALLPLYASPRSEGRKRALACAAAFTAVLVTAIALFLPVGGLREFYNHTIGFQLTRSDVFSVWALHPSLAAIKTLLEVAALGLAAAVAFVPRRRSLPQVCALAAAVLIAVQLPAVHWFYYYVIWFMPYLAIALLAQEPRRARVTPRDELAAVARDGRERILVEA